MWPSLPWYLDWAFLSESLACNRAYTREFCLPLAQDTDITTWQLYTAWRETRVSACRAGLLEVVWQLLKHLNQLFKIANYTVAGPQAIIQSHDQFSLGALIILDKSVEWEVREGHRWPEGSQLFFLFLRHSQYAGLFQSFLASLVHIPFLTKPFSLGHEILAIQFLLSSEFHIWKHMFSSMSSDKFNLSIKEKQPPNY